MINFKKIIQSIFTFLFPPRCYICDNITKNKTICSNCKMMYNSILKIGYLSDFNFQNDLLYASIYESIAKKMILDLKYKKKKQIVDIYIDLIKNNKIFLDYIKNINYITYIPTSKKNIKIRTYDQAKLIADNLSIEFKIPVLKIFEKNENKKTKIKEQKTLTREERLHNVKGNFKLNKNVENIKGNILIVDDVYTTGATAYEVKRILKEKNKNVNIYFFVLGYTIL